ncbi:MAG: methyltransferase [Hyphomicrobiaceae bacterium]|nr:methyltransferase [Hyphomicrobiaceae bacterium]
MTAPRADAGVEGGGLTTTLDAFLGGAVMLHQPARGYRAGSDAVLLAASCAVIEAAPVRVLDVGAGVGAVGLCLARRITSADVTLMEPDARLAALARDNVALNGFSVRVRVIEASVGAEVASHAGAGLEADSFDVALANPPYYAAAAGTLSPAPMKVSAHAMAPALGLEDWARFMARVVRPGGRIGIVHRAASLIELLSALSPRFGELTILPLHPRPGRPALNVIVSGRKGSRAAPTVLPGLVLHGPTGNGYEADVAAVLRAPLPLAVPGLSGRHPVA